MIIANGLVHPLIQSLGGLVNGNPVKPNTKFGDAIVANIRANTRSSIGKMNGNTFTVASYEVLIEESDFKADRVKLIQNGIDLGEFSVICIEYLEAVNIFKVTV